ncbi:MAG: spermidine synthase [Caulobacterales bacterium]
MTEIAGAADVGSRAATDERAPIPALLFALTVFFSAALVFVVEPMIARLVLPVLGGSAAVWNTSLAFFQMALLVGYLYAHLLQRIGRVRVQIVLHLVVLLIAALALPLRVSGILGDPPPDAPALWLVGVLAVSIGAPFAALSATAPLVQAWHARVVRHEGAREPYVLYAASNFGSLIALIAYPVLLEPNLTLRAQTGSWSAGYGVFVIVAAILGTAVWRYASAVGGAAPALAAGPAASWRQRLTWLALAAIPSSLMLGVTSYVTTDIGSAPFLWVAPLALYLVTFIIAFQEKPAIPPAVALTLQSAALALCAVFIHASAAGFLQALAIHLTAFFLTALICHQALVARRPDPARLTEFYIWMSVGGVVGGAFNAFVAPAIFNSVVEYPALLVASCLVRPWGEGRARLWEWAVALAGALIALSAAQISHPAAIVAPFAAAVGRVVSPAVVAPALLGLAAGCAIVLRKRALLFLAVIFSLVLAAERVSERSDVVASWRSFFGVLRMAHTDLPSLGGEVRMLIHGATLHGGQAQAGPYRCRPLVYYAHSTPIGQVFQAELARKPALSIGAVGLGTGTVATYTRPTDSLRFFEIDPLVVRVSSNPAYFSYTTQCARGAIAYTLGDARLTLARQPAGSYDLLLIDAFSSDSVPAHLLTVEAVRMYLSKLRPDGVLILHLSNRNLDLLRPAQAVAIAAGAPALAQTYAHPFGVSILMAADEDAVIVGKSAASLQPFAGDPRWTVANAGGVAPWTDDYTNLFGALVRRTAARWDLGTPRPAVPPPPPPEPPGPLPGR